MTEYDDDMRGVLFPNSNTKNEKSPTVTGKCTIGGIEYRIAGWKRASLNTGKPFFSLVFESEADAQERRKEILETPDDALDL